MYAFSMDAPSTTVLRDLAKRQRGGEGTRLLESRRVLDADGTCLPLPSFVTTGPREPGPDELASASPGQRARALTLERTVVNDKGETMPGLTSAGVEEKVWVATEDLGVVSRGT